MKKTLTLLSAALLSGCQTTPDWLSNWQASGDDSQAQEQRVTNNPAAKKAVAEVELIETYTPPKELLPSEEADLWQRIRRQLRLTVPDNRRVAVQRNWYLEHPEYLERVANRARPFLYMIVEEIEKRDMPLELALLPIVESAFDPFAYSHGRASGVWQFIPGTARHYGLDINWWYDGRRDVYAATNAALDYLEALHNYFDGDWLNALAAYNSGEGRVAHAIRKNRNAHKPTNFWALDLPRETRAYVPKLLALADILKNADSYNITWAPISNQAQLAMVELPSQIDLAKAAEMADMSLEELQRYNSGYNRWATAPEGPHRLLLPQVNAAQFHLALADTSPDDWLTWTRHKVKSGENLLLIAKHYNTTPEVIQQANNIRGSLIHAGDYLLIPVATRDLDEYTLSMNERREHKQNIKHGVYRVDYTVQHGDTLWDISRAYKVNLRSLARWNSMAPTDPLRPGQKLAIWMNDTSRQGAVIRKVTYEVRSGDSLARIAQRFNVTIGQIEKWNQITRKNYLQPGQQLTLLIDVMSSSS